jgi:hypothetical protein
VTFLRDDVVPLLKDVTGRIDPLPTEERERRIQSGVHYSEMLPLERRPAGGLLTEYLGALDNFAERTARAVASVAEMIYRHRGRGVALASFARAGTPVGVLIKRYLRKKYAMNPAHYAISIIRGRGIDRNALEFILRGHSASEIQFVDGWTGKGAIYSQLALALADFPEIPMNRLTLAVLSDPANVTDMCGSHEDFLIASSCLNSTVCGLMSRTILRGDLIGADDFHGVAYYDEFRDDDRTYEFIGRIEALMRYDERLAQSEPPGDYSGLAEAERIAEIFGVSDVNFVKPGLGETTRVLLRRVPDLVLISERADEKNVSHIIKLAGERDVPVKKFPLRFYQACGIIKRRTPDA